MYIFKFIDNLKLRSKFMLLLLTPTLGLLLFGGAHVWERFSTVQQMRQVEELAGLDAEVAGLVHELQKERGRTSLFLGSNGAQSGKELADQRTLTDAHLASLQTTLARINGATYGSEFVTNRDAASQRLAAVTAGRSAVDGLKVATKDALGLYTDSITALLTIDSAIVRAATSPDVAQIVSTGLAFSQMKESTGLERAAVSGAFASGHFEPAQFQQFVSLRAAQGSYFNTFQALATPAELAFYKSTLQGPTVDAVAKMEQQALDQGTAPKLEGVDAAAWFDQITGKIDLLKTVEDRLAQDVVGLAQQHEREAQAALVQMAAIGTAALVIALGAAIVISRGILGPLRLLTEAADRLAEGDPRQTVSLQRHDELGELAGSVRSMIAYQQRMAAAADAIADGDLTRSIAPPSKDDALGQAFARMIANLRSLVGQVQASASSLAISSEGLSSSSSETGASVQEVASAVQIVSEGARQTRATTHTTTEAVGELAQAIDGIARGAVNQAERLQAAHDIATEMAANVERVAASAQSVGEAGELTRESAQRGVGAVAETSAGMAEIRTAVSEAADKVADLGRLSTRIGAVVETIDEIAAQTNLLALNAAIEAARAGAHGKGFAVVADEVRKLAERSGRETQRIADLISEIQEGARDAVSAMESGSDKVQAGSVKADQASAALSDILRAVESNLGEVSQIAEATQHMAGGARSLVDAMSSISAVVEENSACSEEMSAQASQVTHAMHGIAEVTERQSTSQEAVAASAEQMSAQVEEMAAQAQDLAATAEQLRAVSAQFKLESAPANVTRLREHELQAA